MPANRVLFFWLLLCPLPALALLDARAPAVTLWSLPLGFAFGVASLLATPSRRWLFLAVPVALGTLAITADALPLASGISSWDLIRMGGVVAVVLLLQTGAGFLLALIARLSVHALRRSGRPGGSKSKL